MIRNPLYRARDVNEHKYLGPCFAYLVANLLPSFGRRHPLKRLAVESARKVHGLKLLVPSIDVYLWYNRVSALLKLDIISEHAPSSIVKSDLRRAVESARPVQKGLGRHRRATEDVEFLDLKGLGRCGRTHGQAQAPFP